MLTRRSLSFAVLAAAAVPASAHPHNELNAQQQGDIERQLAAFRNEMKDAVAAKDVAKLRTMYADSYTHTHGSAKMDGKDARIVSLLAGDPAIETAPVTELSIRVHGPDMAIMTGRSPILNKQENRSYDFRWMQVYTRASGNWQLAASQATRLAVTS
jgi:ketosteroid isomerase-like protein